MKTTIGAMFGVPAIGAAPASARLYKAGTATATLRPAHQDRTAAMPRSRPVAPPFDEAGTVNLMLQPPATRDTPRRHNRYVPYPAA